MTGIKRSPMDFSIRCLDNELIARGMRDLNQKDYSFLESQDFPLRDEIMAQTRQLYQAEKAPVPDQTLDHISTPDLVKSLILKIKESEDEKALRGEGMRLEIYEINHPQIQRNARAVVSIWMKDSVKSNHDGTYSLHCGYYGKSFNLHFSEPFYKQPIARGRLCTGFLVKPGVIATAGHCAEECNVTRLRFVFGYRMSEPGFPVTQVPETDVYRGVEILDRVYSPRSDGADWALVKLDREVNDRVPVTLAKESVRPGESVYVLGHPCGLPLKFVSPEPVTRIAPAFFSAQLTVYGGNSGSPVFHGKTHELVGIVVRGDQQDFRWTGNGWMSIRYPNPSVKSSPPQCTRVSQFRTHCR